jgi:hypothetical protein
MCISRAAAAALLGVALACATARADEPRTNDPAPDAGFLEFLGGVDQLADVNPDYLTPGKSAHPVSPPPKPPANPPPPPPAPQPGAKSNE